MIKVTCAIIEKDGKILIAQRSEKMSLPLKWEFPGGKIERNETEQDCIVREIREEFSIDIIPVKRLPESNHSYSENAISLIPFICKYELGDIILKEHKTFLWIEKEKLFEFELADADIPIANNYLNI